MTIHHTGLTKPFIGTVIPTVIGITEDSDGTEESEGSVQKD